ncbi:MAG: sporulation protein YunB [Oscillospiraceae bacterium]
MICASRRWRPAARRRRPLRPKRKLAALLLVLILLGGMAYFTVSVLHLITQLAVNSACDLMQLKINAATSAATAQVQGRLLYLPHGRGRDHHGRERRYRARGAGVLARARAHDGRRRRAGRAGYSARDALRREFLPGLKLPLPVRILVLTTSDVSYHNELMSAAINQSKYQLYLNVKMDLDILVPWEHQAETVGTNVLLAETVIVGKVPQTYVEVE